MKHISKHTEGIYINGPVSLFIEGGLLLISSILFKQMKHLAGPRGTHRTPAVESDPGSGGDARPWGPVSHWAGVSPIDFGYRTTNIQ